MTDQREPASSMSEDRLQQRRTTLAGRGRGRGLARIERPPGISERVFLQLRAAIVRREIAPGAPVVIEQLAEALGVSRTPIREALPALQQLGLIVEAASSSSYRVAPLDANYAREVYAVRSALECLLVEEVTPLLTDDDFRQLREHSSSGPPVSSRTPEQMLESDVAFHDVLRARSPFPFLNVLIDSVRVHRARLLEFENLDEAQYREQSNEEHLAIIQALEQRNGPAARRLMRAHLDRVGGAIAQLAARQAPE